MAPPKPKSDYIETETGNKVARRAQLHGTQHIILGGRVIIQPDVCIRGDLIRTSQPQIQSSSTTASEGGTTTLPKQLSAAAGGGGGGTSVSIGRYTFISQGAILRPPHRIYKGALSFHPLKIGEHTFIGEGTVVEAASVGDHVVVGKGAVVGNMAILKDWVKVLDGCVISQGMVVSSGCVVAGRPGRVVGEVGDGWGVGEAEGGDLREVWRGVG